MGDFAGSAVHPAMSDLNNAESGVMK